jgi:formylglycine-generating enzyme required for sulfatase activity
LYQAKGDNTTHPVANLKPNDFGLFDMQGNVYEWCYDAYASYPALSGEAAFDAPSATEIDKIGRRVLRGGSFYFRPSFIRSASRLVYLPVDRSDDVGFRPARTYHPEPDHRVEAEP